MDWRDYFSGPTLEEQALDQMRQEYLSNALGLPQGTDLTPDDWLQQIDLARINNDLSAEAGRARSAPGIGYMFESPESAEQNRLQNSWGEEWNKRIGTANYDPRYAQGATSFAPNQFSPTSPVYVDPFMQEGSRGGLREQVRSLGPTIEDTLQGEPFSYRRRDTLAGQPIRQAGVPQMPAGMDQKAMGKLFGDYDKQIATQRAERQKEIKTRIAAQQKAQDKINRDWQKEQWKRRNDRNDPNSFIVLKSLPEGKERDQRIDLYFLSEAEYAAHFRPDDYNDFVELSGLDPTSDIAKLKYASKLRAEADSQYRERLQKAAQSRATIEQSVKSRQRSQEDKGLPRFLGLPVQPEHAQVMRGETGLPSPLAGLSWPSAATPPAPGKDPYEELLRSRVIQEILRKQREGI